MSKIIANTQLMIKFKLFNELYANVGIVIEDISFGKGRRMAQTLATKA